MCPENEHSFESPLSGTVKRTPLWRSRESGQHGVAVCFLCGLPKPVPSGGLQPLKRPEIAFSNLLKIDQCRERRLISGWLVTAFNHTMEPTLGVSWAFFQICSRHFCLFGDHSTVRRVVHARNDQLSKTDILLWQTRLRLIAKEAKVPEQIWKKAQETPRVGSMV